MRVIKLTEKQIQEAEGNFEYFTGSTTPNYNGQKEVTVSGKLEQDEYGKPTTTDSFASTQHPMSYARYGFINSKPYTTIKENDENKDGVDDFYNHKDANVLTDNDNMNNLTRIPKGVENRLNRLISQMENSSLNPRQRAAILTRLIDVCNLGELDHSWRKELVLKINAKNVKR